MLSVESYDPLKQGVIKNNNINVKFTKDIDRASISGSVILAIDNDRNISCIDSFYDGNITGVKVDIKYEDRVIKVIPTSVLDSGNKYVLVIRGNLKSIEGELLLHDLVIPFYKEEEIKAPAVMYPTHNSIVQEVYKIDFNACSEVSRVQVSKDIDFTNLIINTVVHSYARSFIPEKNITKSGNYFLRVGTDNVFSEVVQVYVDNYSKGIETTDVDFAFTCSDDGEPSNEVVTVTITPGTDSRVYTSYDKILITIDEVVDTSSVDISFSKIYDFLIEEDVFEDIIPSSITTTSDEQRTYIIISLGGEYINEEKR